MADALDELAARFGFRFSQNPLDFLRGPAAIARRKQLELKNFLDARAAARASEAREQLLNPPELHAGTTGASPTEDPEGATADLQRALANEEAQRFAASPTGRFARQALLLKEAGLDPAALELARYRRTRADDAAARAAVIQEILADPNTDPLLRVDIAHNKEVSEPRELVKVRNPDGREVYYHRRRLPTGHEEFLPALDPEGRPLEVPTSASAYQETALQKNARFIARTMFPGDPDGLRRAVQLLTVLKDRSPQAAWAQLVSEVSRMQFGRFARDPRRLYEKTLEIWRVARPGEPPPEPPPEAAPDAPAAPAPDADRAAPGAAAPAPATPPPDAPRARNPQTGEEARYFNGAWRVFRGGQWQPVR